MKKKSIWRLAAVLLAVVAIIVAIWFAGFQDFGRIYSEDLVIDSPDGNHRLLIREWETIGGTGAEIYAINPELPMWLNQLTKKELGKTIADDCCLPFSTGKYEITWGEGYVEICYFSGRNSENSADPSTWQTVKCLLP